MISILTCSCSLAKVHEENACFQDDTIRCLDNTQQFAKFLPIEDPLNRHLESVKRSFTANHTTKKKLPRTKSSHPFVQISDSFKTGPLCVLRNLQEQRVCVITRYVNAIRGSLTGTLVAFDKHMNLVLLDVEETYSSRPLERGTLTNVQVEVERRQNLSRSHGHGTSKAVGRRTLKQIMLRGDNVVSVCKAKS